MVKEIQIVLVDKVTCHFRKFTVKIQNGIDVFSLAGMRHPHERSTW